MRVSDHEKRLEIACKHIQQIYDETDYCAACTREVLKYMGAVLPVLEGRAAADEQTSRLLHASDTESIG